MASGHGTTWLATKHQHSIALLPATGNGGWDEEDTAFQFQKAVRRRKWAYKSYDEIIDHFKASNAKRDGGVFESTACYFCFSSAKETTVIEKDLITARVRSSDDFIVITNNDEEEPHSISASASGNLGVQNASNVNGVYGMAIAEIIEEAKNRKQCAENIYKNMRRKAARRKGMVAALGDDAKRLLETVDIVKLVQRYPTTNEVTHFACVLDPQSGKIAWCRRWLEPVDTTWITKHS